ncbi:glomulin-like [Patiria miniata]|uniref:Glomulin n=1 Tax=Patiria miniata TaxID=46514 RepID=A0A914AIG9_PATMI|nr:glomulin-like [Patiria miniata]
MESSLRKSARPFKGWSAKSLRRHHDEASKLLSTVKECMDYEDSQQVREIMCDEAYKGLVEYIAWDLLPILGPHLSDKETNEEMYQNCVQIIIRLAELGNPKEMFIGLLEQLDRFLDSLVHNDLLGPLQTVIRRLGLAKPLYYNQLLTTLYAHMELLKVPSVNGMGAMERRLISQDPDYSKVETTSLVLLEFLVPLVQDVEEALVTNVPSQNPSPKNIKDIEATRTEIMKFVLNILEHPLIAIEFKYQDDADEEEEMKELGINAEARQQVVPRQEEYSLSKKSAEQCMLYLELMGCSFSYLLLYASQRSANPDAIKEQLKKKKKKKKKHEDDGKKEETLPVLGLSCFAYMLLVEGYQTNRMPSIFSTVYMMEVVMPYVEAMLRRPEEPIILKGLELLRSVVDRLDEQSLNSNLLDTKQNFLQVTECMVQIMVYCPSKTIRRIAVSVLSPYMDRFDWKGRYHILRSLFISTTHPGAKGMLIGKLKDYVHSTLQSDSHNDWFVGVRSHKLWVMIFKLDKGERTDLLNSADKEIAVLNFLRYLLLRDSGGQDLTGIWPWLGILQQVYLNPLQSCLSGSRTHYTLKVESTWKEIRRAEMKKENLTGILTVGGQQFPMMPLPEQVKVLETAVYTFDLIGSIVSRVNEIIKTYKHLLPVEGDTSPRSLLADVHGAGDVDMDI